MAFVLRVLRAIFEPLDFAAQFVGGWPVIGTAVVSTGSLVWAILQDLGVFSVILFFYVMAIAMIVFEELGRLWRRWRRASRSRIAHAASLRKLTQEGGAIITDWKYLKDPQGTMIVWTAHVLKCLEDEPFHDYYGFESMDMAGRLNKLRLITMRYAEKHRIVARQVLEFEKGQQ